MLARLESLESRRLLSAGDLVTSFAADGLLDIGKPISTLESAVVPVEDGKFLLLTSTGVPAQFQRPVAVLERHNADGSLDTTFATDGVANYSFGESFYGAKTTADGKIVVLSSTYQSPTVTLLNADGSIDTAFGTDGRVDLKEASGNNSFYISDFDVADDGKIFVLGMSNQLFRLTTDGAVDPTFTKFTYTHFGNSGWDQIQALPGGKVMLGGMAMEHEGNRFEFVRPTNTGAPDTTSGGTGYIYNGFQVDGFYVQPDNKLLIGGFTYSRNVLLIRHLNENGGAEVPTDGLRLAFGKLQGRVKFAPADDGKVIVYTNTSMARLNADGTYDASFGRLTTQYFAGQIDLGGALVRANGDVLAAGSAGTDGRVYLLHGDDTADTTWYQTSGQKLTLTGTAANDGFFIEPATDDIYIRRQNGFGRILNSAGITQTEVSLLAGNDRAQVYNTTMPTTLSGGEGSDTIIASNGDDALFGDGGKDIIFGYDGNDTISGGASSDYIHGGAGDDDISGNGGNDKIRGWLGNDTMHGNAGVDSFWCQEDGMADSIFGDGGADMCWSDDLDTVASAYEMLHI